MVAANLKERKMVQIFYPISFVSHNNIGKRKGNHFCFSYSTRVMISSLSEIFITKIARLHKETKDPLILAIFDTIEILIWMVVLILHWFYFYLQFHWSGCFIQFTATVATFLHCLLTKTSHTIFFNGLVLVPAWKLYQSSNNRFT